MEDIHAVDLDLDLPVFGIQDVDIRLAEDHEQVALAGVLQIVGHVQVGVHARLEHRDRAQLAEFGRAGIVVEGAGDQHIEAGIARLRAPPPPGRAGPPCQIRAR